MKTELPMTMLGIEASKGGRGDKEPIYKVKASFCRGYALCLLIAIMLAGALFFYEDPDDANRFLTASAVRARRAAQTLRRWARRSRARTSATLRSTTASRCATRAEAGR